MRGRSLGSVSCGQKGVFGRLSLAQKFPFPGRGGDWFDDRVVGLQFEPPFVLPAFIEGAIRGLALP